VRARRSTRSRSPEPREPYAAYSVAPCDDQTTDAMRWAMRSRPHDHAERGHRACGYLLLESHVREEVVLVTSPGLDELHGVEVHAAHCVVVA
jgi:hypothetical protein